MIFLRLHQCVWQTRWLNEFSYGDLQGSQAISYPHSVADYERIVFREACCLQPLFAHHRAIVVDRPAIQRLIRRLGVRSSVTGEYSDVSGKAAERLITMVQPKRSRKMTAKLGWQIGLLPDAHATINEQHLAMDMGS